MAAPKQLARCVAPPTVQNWVWSGQPVLPNDLSNLLPPRWSPFSHFPFSSELKHSLYDRRMHQNVLDLQIWRNCWQHNQLSCAICCVFGLLPFCATLGPKTLAAIRLFCFLFRASAQDICTGYYRKSLLLSGFLFFLSCTLFCSDRQCIIKTFSRIKQTNSNVKYQSSIHLEHTFTANANSPSSQYWEMGCSLSSTHHVSFIQWQWSFKAMTKTAPCSHTVNEQMHWCSRNVWDVHKMNRARSLSTFLDVCSQYKHNSTHLTVLFLIF